MAGAMPAPATRDCPRCGASPSSVEARDGGSRKCRACGLVFDPKAAVTKRSKVELNAPEGFHATLMRRGMESSFRDGTAGDAELRIVRKWKRTPGIQLLMAGIWIFVSLFVPVLGIERGAPALLYAVIVSIAVLVGYAIVAGRVNRTHITVASGSLSIRHAPLPWWGNVEVDAESIMQIYCQDYASKLDPETDLYRVFAIIRGSRRPTVVVEDLELASYAVFLEHAIERALGIEDRPVDGEIDVKLPPAKNYR